MCLDDEKLDRLGFRTHPNHQNWLAARFGTKILPIVWELGIIAVEMKVIWGISGKELLELQLQPVKHNETLRQGGIQGERKCRSDDVSIWEDKLRN